MRRVLAGGLAIVAALTAPVSVRAQWQVTADAGVSHLRQAGIPESMAQTLAATVDGVGNRAWLHAVGLSSRQTNSAWTGQAVALGGVTGQIANPLRWELGGVFSGFRQTGAITTTSGEVNARLRFGGALGGVALGGGAGASGNSYYNVALGRGSLDAWWSSGHERLLASAMLTHIGSTSYTDLAAGWRHEAGAASIGATAALRSGTGAVNGNGGWQAADAELWVSSRLAIVLAAGNALPDVVRGTPSTRYASASLRVAWQPHVALRFGRRADAGVRVIIKQSSDGGLARIDVSGPKSGRMELMADFTGWEPIVLERAGDGWFVDRAVTPGLHRLAIRIDGGAWIAPSNVPKLRDDDLAGTVGLITVP
jgi:hypothetical protein